LHQNKSERAKRFWVNPVLKGIKLNTCQADAHRILVGEPDGKRPLGRPRHSCVDNIKIDFRKIDWMVWIGLIWLRIGSSGGLL
jgi:hypothetical protein